MRTIAKGHWKTTDLVQQVLRWDESSRKGHQRESEATPWPESNTCTHTRARAHACVHTHMHVPTHIHTYNTSVHLYVHTHTHGHEHTHTHTLLPPGTQFQGHLLTLCGHCHLSDWGPDPSLYLSPNHQQSFSYNCLYTLVIQAIHNNIFNYIKIKNIS